MGVAAEFIFIIIFLMSLRSRIVSGADTTTDDDPCLAVQFRCPDGRCLPPSWRCDGRVDCEHGEDEPEGCNTHGFECFTGSLEVPWESVCDGTEDCTNGEDEEQECQAFECPDGKTLPASAVCDGKDDCDGSEEEAQCFNAKKSPCHELRCEDGSQCFDRAQFCDGVQNCNDGSDEAYCPVKRSAPGCFSCDGGTRCIRYRWLCDAFMDCNDFTDESHVLCPTLTERCWRGAFRCAHKNYCVMSKYRCDGVNDCGDASDETTRCGQNTFWADQGGWTRWSPWSECNTTCGEGTRTRRRKCYPQAQCEGEDTETEPCQVSCTNTTHFLSGSGEILRSGCGVRHIEGHGPPTTRIIGGVTSVEGSWPWQAQLWFKYRRHSNILACGGTLITDRIVLTAAHCFLHYRGKEASRWSIDLGKGNSKRFLDRGRGHHRSGVLKIFHYESFNAFDLWQDIAIMVLKKPVEGFTSKISPACLDNGIVDVTSEKALCYATGFGVTQVLTGVRATHLQEARLPVIDHVVCNHADVYNDAISEDMFCAGFLEGKIDACKGDSGGPYICHHQQEDRWYLVGITSWGHGCALRNKPGVYTNVTHFRPWIDNIVKQVVPELLSSEG